jgi:hypothetical protein
VRSGAGGGTPGGQPVRIAVTDTPVDRGDSEFGSHITGGGNRGDGLLGKRDATFASTVEKGTAPKQAGNTAAKDPIPPSVSPHSPCSGGSGGADGGNEQRLSDRKEQ